MDGLLSMIIVCVVFVYAFNKVAKAPAAAARQSPRPFSVEVEEEDPIPYASHAAKPAAAPARAEQLSMLPPKPMHHTPEGESHPTAPVARMRSLEGRDPCHEAQLQPAARPADVSPLLTVEEEAPVITMDFTKDALLRAVVMQEVLTRPCERRNRRIR